MSDTLNLNVRIRGALRDHVSRELDSGVYENVSEYVRALIRRDQQLTEQMAFEKMKTQLQADFAQKDEDCTPLSADNVLARNATL
jgi:antitoxin ParD1/3/4